MHVLINLSVRNVIIFCKLDYQYFLVGVQFCLTYWVIPLFLVFLLIFCQLFPHSKSSIAHYSIPKGLEKPYLKKNLSTIFVFLNYLHFSFLFENKGGPEILKKTVKSQVSEHGKSA